MFFAFHQVPQQYIENVRVTVLNWCYFQELTVYLERDAAPHILEKRLVTEPDLAFLETLVRKAEQNILFGGFVAGNELTDINGLCFFELDEAREKARLVGFLINDKLADLPPFQSPLLHLPLISLIQQEPYLEKFYLPLQLQEPSKEDFIRLALYDLAPAEEAGWWYLANVQAMLTGILNEQVGEAGSKWLEISLQVDPDLLDYVSRLFIRYGYQQRLVVERPSSDGKNIDESAPAIVRTYLPVNERADANIKEVSAKLAELNTLRPIGEVFVVERSNKYWAKLWDKVTLYRIGQKIVLMPSGQSYSPAPGEIVVEIAPSLDIFAIGLDGPHPTTTLALELMEEFLEPAEHKKMLDLGTGSGILAIVAARMGIGYTLALDAYPPALEAARENISRNGVSDQIVVEAGSLAVRKKSETLVYSFEEEAQQPPAILEQVLPFDAIVCNTFAHVLVSLADALVGALRPGGLLISSGIARKKGDEVAAAFEAAGLKLLKRHETAHWVAFAHHL
ncbi:MAG: 50S ribosomal protein L11 methyltransferase [Chloroflexota bacterium]|nr:50S ribosomal protein L11 methyltransferase [Chloroflexota bacterium]